MATEQEIAKLIIRLQGQTAELKQDFNKAQGHVSNFASSVKKILAGIGVAVLATKLKNLVKEAIDLQDQMAKTSQRVGVTTETLSGLKYAAQLSGVQFGSLTSALRIFSKNMYDAAGGVGEAIDAINDLNIVVTDESGHLKSMEVVLSEVADRFAEMEDGTLKTALASRIFGRSGAELIPLLNQGSKGIKQLTDEAKKLGIVIDSQAAKAAEQFNDNLTRLRSLSQGLFISIANELLPTLNAIAEAMIESGKRAKDYGESFLSIANIFKEVVKAGLRLKAAIEWVATGIGGIFAAIVESTRGNVAGASAIMDQLKDDMDRIITSIEDTIKKMDKPFEPFKKATIEATGEIKKFGQAAEDLAKIRIEASLSKELKGIEAMAQLSQQQYELGKITIAEYYNEKRRLAQAAADAEIKALEALKEKAKDKAELEKIELSIFEKRADLARELSSITHDETMKVKEFSEKLKEMTEIRAGRSDIGAYYDQEIAELGEVYSEMIRQVQSFDEEKFQIVNNGITREQALKELAAAQDIKRTELTTKKELAIKQQYYRNLSNVYGDLASMMGDLYDISGGKAEEFFRLQKAFSMAQAIMNAHEAASKAMAQGGIWGVVQAGMIFAKAMIHAMAIGSQQPPKFARGGPVLGGSGTKDDVHIIAQGGEYMMPKNAVRHYGIAAMEAIKSMAIPKNAFSGLLSMPQMAAAGGTSYSINIPISIEDSRLAGRLRGAIERTVIEVMRDYG